MDFQLAEDQVTVNDLARDIFSRNGDPQRLFDIEAGQDRFDRVLHRDLADSGVLGLLVPEEHGGAGLGLWEVAGVFVEQGRTLGTVPLWETLVGGVLPLVRYGDARQQAEWLPRVAAGDAVLTVAVDDLADARPYGARVRARSGAEPGGAGVTLSGTAVGVRSAHLADAIIVPATDEEGTVGLYLVPTAGPGVRRDTFERTDRGLASDVHLEGAAAELLAEGPEEDRIDWLLRQVWIAVAALQSGISQAAVRRGRRLHLRPRAVRCADRDLPGRRPPDRQLPHRHRGDGGHLPQRALARDDRAAAPRGRTRREVLGCRGGRPCRAHRAARARRHGCRRHLPDPPLHALDHPAGQHRRLGGLAAAAARGPRRRGGAAVSGTQITIEQVSLGDTLPELEIPLTRTLIVAGALATRDYEDVHHDPAQAERRGTPDTYMSINNTNGLVGRYVTDWAGPAARMVRLSTRLGVPNFPDDVMRLTGEVVGVEEDTVRVAVRGMNSKGAHAVSEVTVRLPRGTEQ